MTVHGAKGLEAPIVFLPDTCGAPSKGRDKLVAIGEGIARPSGIDAPLVWPVKGANRIAAVADGKAAAKSAEEEEHRRLLYVALTRPRDRLYVAGYEGKKRRPAGCWYDLVTQGLATCWSSTSRPTAARCCATNRARTRRTIPVAMRRSKPTHRCRRRTGRIARRHAKRAWWSRWRRRGWHRSIPTTPANRSRSPMRRSR